MGHIVLNAVDASGKVKMTTVDTAAYNAAIAANAANAKRVRNAAMQAKGKNPGVSAAAAANIKVADVVKVPKPVPVVDKEISLGFNGVYQLPENNQVVKNYVTLGYLVEVAAPVVATPVAPVIPPVDKNGKNGVNGTPTAPPVVDPLK